jgi:hypothetical protein
VPVLRRRSAKCSRVGEARRWRAGKECRFWAHYRSTRSLSHCWTEGSQLPEAAEPRGFGLAKRYQETPAVQEAARYVARYAAASNIYKLEHGIMHHDICAAHLEKKRFIWPRADSPRCILFAFSDLARPRVQNQPTQRALSSLSTYPARSPFIPPPS